MALLIVEIVVSLAGIGGFVWLVREPRFRLNHRVAEPLKASNSFIEEYYY